MKKALGLMHSKDSFKLQRLNEGKDRCMGIYTLLSRMYDDIICDNVGHVHHRSHVRHSRSRTHGRCTRSVEVTAHATGARASGHVGHWCRVHAVVDRIRFKACASSTFLQCKKVP
uniref:Uncharacterized protein n=1 Tax=Spodoptera frugiperda nuclear polyhedrosis virus TaxID=10455 RepID=A0A0R5RHK1_NPVSF|nr:hypothetical protein [Spodoptera frugiperda multiple nucleopolyhedrovirus]